MSEDNSSSETVNISTPISIKMGQISKPNGETKRVRFVSPDASMRSDNHIGFSSPKAKEEYNHYAPIKMQIAYYITVVIYLVTTSSFATSVFGFLLTEQYRLIVGAGVIVAFFAIGAAGLVTFSGRALTHTAVLQGYLILGILSVVSLSAQLGIVALLTEIKKRYRNHNDLTTWVEFLGGAQWVMATMAGVIVIVSCILTYCGSSIPRDSTVRPVVLTS